MQPALVADNSAVIVVPSVNGRATFVSALSLNDLSRESFTFYVIVLLPEFSSYTNINKRHRVFWFLVLKIWFPTLLGIQFKANLHTHILCRTLTMLLCELLLNHGRGHGMVFVN
jgi:hypothetical protein